MARACRPTCRTHGGFYLGSIGGPAARLARDCIRKVEVLEYPELGMEAVWRIEVQDFPAFIVVDDKGNDFFAEVNQPLVMSIPRREGMADTPADGQTPSEQTEIIAPGMGDVDSAGDTEGNTR